MPTPTKGPRLGGGPAHERLMLANLATQLFDHRSITTTQARAKRVRPLAERLITFAKRGDLASRRRVMTVVRDKSVVHFLFTEIAPAMAERPGGYTRITKIGPRKGDNAPMAVIELVMEPYSPKQATVKEAEAATKRSVKEADTARAAAADDAAEADAPAAGGAPEGVATLADIDADAGTAPDADSAEPAEVVGESPYEGSHPPLSDGSQPDGFPIKGNEDSGKYHTPDSPWYEQTVAEVWFATEEAASTAGFTKAGGGSEES